LGNDLLSALLSISMLHVALNATGTKCFEQVNDVDVLGQEDKFVSYESILFRKSTILVIVTSNLGEHSESLRVLPSLQNQSSIQNLSSALEPISSFKTFLKLRTCPPLHN
jgi:hypothetical protein